REGVLFQLTGQPRPSQILPAQTAASWLAQAQAAHRAGRLQEALAAYEQALQLAPQDPAAAQGRAAVQVSLQQAAPRPPETSPASPQPATQTNVPPAPRAQAQPAAPTPARLPEAQMMQPITSLLAPNPVQSLPPSQGPAPQSGEGVSAGAPPFSAPPTAQ